MDRGEILWQIAHGETPDNVRNHPKLKGLSIPRTGQPCAGLAGLVVTKTLVIGGECAITTTATGRARGDAAGLRQGDGERGRARSSCRRSRPDRR